MSSKSTAEVKGEESSEIGFVRSDDCSVCDGSGKIDGITCFACVIPGGVN